MILYVRKKGKYGEIKGNKGLRESDFSCQKAEVFRQLPKCSRIY